MAAVRAAAAAGLGTVADVSTYETLVQGLDGLRDPQTFAELASVLLLDDHPELVMGARTADLGRDARVQLGIWGEEVIVIQYSLERKWQTKIDRELKRYDTDKSLPKRMIYVTHLTATAKAQKTRIDKAAKNGVLLRIYDRGWLWPRLEHKHRKLAERLLGLRPALPGRFVEASERRTELEQRIPGFSAPLVPTPGLQKLDAELQSRDCQVLLLVGPGGSGKTRAALSSVPTSARSLVLEGGQGFDRDAVGALIAYESGVVIIDDAHGVNDLSGLRLLLQDAAWKGWTVVMTLRPGFADGVLDNAAVEADQVTQIAFGELPRPQAAKLLADKPYEITVPEAASYLVDLARGNLLMLHLAAQAAKRGDLSPRGQADLLREYVRRLRRSVPDGLHDDLLVMAAFYGQLTLTERLALIRHLHPAAALPDIRVAFSDLADAGFGLVDGDTFTVVPDAIAPVLVLDSLLRSAGTARLRLADLVLPTDGSERERILPVFCAAVVYGHGQGGSDLQAFVGSARPDQTQPLGAWMTALREARLYAHGLPLEAAQVIQSVLRFPAQELSGQPTLLNAAADAAHALVDVSLKDGLPLLLEAVALATDDERALSSPAKTLEQLLERSTTYGGSRVTRRTEDVLTATRAWVAQQPDSPARQRVGLRVSLMLITVAYEYFGQSASDAMAINLGAVAAPDTPGHRAAIRAAAKYGAELVASADQDALREVGRVYPALLMREAGMSPAPVNELPDALRAAMRPAVGIVRNALLAEWDRLPVSARLSIMQADDNRRIARRAGTDTQLQQLALIYGIAPAGTVRAREWESLQRRARDLGRSLGPSDALDLLTTALENTDGRFQLLGASNLLIGAGEETSRTCATDAVQRMNAEPLLRPFLGSLLAGAMQGPGVADSGLTALATNPDTAVQTVDVLDLVSPAQEIQLTEMLVRQPTAHAALADHLTRCRRPDVERAEALLDLAERTSTSVLAQVLEPFGALSTSLGVPDALRERFTAQMQRVAREAALDRHETGDVSDAYTLVVGWQDESWLEILDARRQAMLAAPASVEHCLWDLVPHDFEQAINQLSEHQRDRALPRLAAWLDETDGDRGGWRVQHGLTELLSRVGAGRPELAMILRDWYAEGANARSRTLQMLSTLLARDAATHVLDAILENAMTDEDESELIGALSLPPMSWAGDLEEEYIKRADVLAKRTRRGSKRGQAFARTAEAHLRHLADSEAQETLRGREGYAR